MLRGQTVQVLLNPTIAGELEPLETFAPAQLELLNGVRTLAGSWRRRPGYAQWKGTQIMNRNSEVVGLRDFNENLLIISDNGVVVVSALASAPLGIWDKEIGVVDVNSRPHMCEFNSLPVIVSGGAPAIIDHDNVTRLGLDIDAPTIKPLISQATHDRNGIPQGLGSHGRSAGQWVYAYTFVTVNGETLLSQPSNPVTCRHGQAAPLVIVPATDHRYVTARRLYAARYYGDDVASVYRLVGEFQGRTAFEHLDQKADDELGEIEPASNTAKSLAPYGARYVASASGFLVVAGYDQFSFAFSSSRQWLSWPSENTRAVDTASGPITGLGTLGTGLLVFCRNATEVWGVLGGNLPFTRRQRIDIGCIAPETVIQVRDSYYFLGHDRDLYTLGGEGPRPVSIGNRSWFLDIEFPGDIYAIYFPYERRIRYFSPEKLDVLVYDLANKCFTRETKTDPQHEQRAIPLTCGTPFMNRMIVGRKDSGDIYDWSFAIPTDEGTAINVVRRLRIPLSPNGHRARCQRIRIRLDRNNRTQVGPTRPPFIIARWGFDGGCQDREELYLNEDGDGPYVDICAPGVGRELTLEITEGDDVNYLVTHAFVTALDLGR